MGKVSNVFTMLELLSNGKKYSIKELSERLEVSERMIRSYKEELEIAGIYIDSIRGQYGGYILNMDKVLPNRSFSKYDSMLLKNIYKLLKNNKNFGLNKELLDLIDKVDGIYKSSKKKSSIVNLNSKEDKDKFNSINKALKNKNKVLIKFLSSNGETIDRIIHPCDMYLYNKYWYVAAFCELRNEIRHFRLERILEYKILEEKYF